MPDVIREGKRPPLMQQRSRKWLWSFVLRVLHEPHVEVITYIMNLSWLQALVIYLAWPWGLNLQLPFCSTVVHFNSNAIGWSQLITVISVNFLLSKSSQWPNRCSIFFWDALNATGCGCIYVLAATGHHYSQDVASSFVAASAFAE